MTCQCGYADECDGEWATFHPLQDGGMCSVRQCKAPMSEASHESDIPERTAHQALC